MRTLFAFLTFMTAACSPPSTQADREFTEAQAAGLSFRREYSITGAINGMKEKKSVPLKSAVARVFKNGPSSEPTKENGRFLIKLSTDVTKFVLRYEHADHYPGLSDPINNDKDPNEVELRPLEPKGHNKTRETKEAELKSFEESFMKQISKIDEKDLTLRQAALEFLKGYLARTRREYGLDPR